MHIQKYTSLIDQIKLILNNSKWFVFQRKLQPSTCICYIDNHFQILAKCSTLYFKIK